MRTPTHGEWEPRFFPLRNLMRFGPRWVISVIFFLLIVTLFAPSSQADEARSAVSIDDLVGRARIVLAAISPDGRYAAWLTARGNPAKDAYEMRLEVTDMKVMGTTSAVLAAYDLDGGETFDNHDSLRPSAGSLRWTSRGVLLFAEKTAGKMRLLAWEPQTNAKRTILKGYDKILLDDSDRASDNIAVRTLSVIPGENDFPAGVPDFAWRIRDDDRFYGVRPNAKNGQFVRTQRWSISLDGSMLASVRTDGPAQDEWDHLVRPALRAPTHAIHESLETDHERIYPYSIVESPHGKRSAFVQIRYVDIDKPAGSSTEFSVAVSNGRKERILTAPTRSHREILGWATEDGPIYFLETSGTHSSVSAVTLRGTVAAIATAPAKFEKPCVYSGRLCQVLTTSGRFGLLVRSTHTMPQELVRIDLVDGDVKVVASPNSTFQTKELPAVQFYEIEGGTARGHLYLPIAYKRGTRYPLVITQYLSDPGFYASVGDEIPILALTASGLGVFAMHAPGGSASATGNVEIELTRVQRPLEDMKWVIEKLTNEGVIDPKRVGLSGLSYGAEIAMFAYWRSDLFAAVSTASGSWDPSLFALSGVDYAKSLARRGFRPVGEDKGINAWQRLAVGLNARPTLPPLLIQGSEGEQNFTAPTWTALRLANAPVEWYDYPEPKSGHVKARPANKWWVYTRNLDWFRFWLQGYEDPTPSKSEQYVRWREMRSKRCDLFKGADVPSYCRQGTHPN